MIHTLQTATGNEFISINETAGISTFYAIADQLSQSGAVLIDKSDNTEIEKTTWDFKFMDCSFTLQHSNQNGISFFPKGNTHSVNEPKAAIITLLRGF